MSDKYIYEEEVSGDKKLESALRESINIWSNTIPHHPYKNLGNKIDIKSIWYRPSYPIQVRSQYEERSKNKEHVPFTGQKIPPRKFHELSDFNSWDIRLVEIMDFENSDESYIVSGSQYVANCHHCHASGKVTCHTCHGNRSITCPVCGGSKETQCNSCGGRGDNRCSTCGGTGRQSKQVARSKQVWVNNGNDGYYRTETHYETVSSTCGNCGGAGRKRCRNCSGTGKVTCNRCNGSGRVTCPTCSGRGELQCPVCKGQKQLMHYFYVNRVLNYSDQETCAINENVWNHFPEFLEEFTEYERRSIHIAKGETLKKNQLSDDHRFNKYINEFLKEAEKTKTNSHPIVSQQLDIYCIDTWEIRYLFKGKEYVMVFTGSQYEVIPGWSPISEVAFQYWEKGLSAKHWLQYSRASKLLTKAVDINVFEIKTKVNYALEVVAEKINQSYVLGNLIAFLIIAFFGAFVSYTYYSEVNYVFDYVSFINNPDGFLYEYHVWAQTILSGFIIFLAYILSRSMVKHFGHHIPSAILRVVTGIVFTTVISIIFLIAWAFLNAIGVSIIVTFIIWLVVKIILILWWIIKIVIGLVIVAFQIIWGILKWIWGLFF